MLKAPRNFYKDAMINFIKAQHNQTTTGPQLVALCNQKAQSFYGTTTTTSYPYGVIVHHKPKANMSTKHIPMNVYKFMKTYGKRIAKNENCKVDQYQFNF